MTINNKESVQSIRRRKASGVDVTEFLMLLTESVKAVLTDATSTANAEILREVANRVNLETTVDDLLKFIHVACKVLEKSSNWNTDSKTRKQRKAVIQKLVELQARIERA